MDGDNLEDDKCGFKAGLSLRLWLFWGDRLHTGATEELQGATTHEGYACGGRRLWMATRLEDNTRGRR